jgi:hypothetical protein
MRGEWIEALIWYYPDPIPEAARIKGHLCPFNEKVDLEVDGEEQKGPMTQWAYRLTGSKGAHSALEPGW